MGVIINMSQNRTQVIADNIRKYRLEKKWSQDDLANKMKIARPTISKWENAQSEPSSSQLAELSEIMGISPEVLLGSSSKKPQKVIVLDTSVLIKKPVVINELIETFDEVIIPDIVINELNYQKDKKPKRSVNQRAWLAMANIQEKIDNKNPKIKVCTIEYGQEDDNDQKIARIAKQRASLSIKDQVYIYTDDIYFKFLVENYSNLTVVTPKNYEELFPDEDESDPIVMQELFAAIKLKNVEIMNRLDEKKININKHDKETGYTPMIAAVRNNDQKMIIALLSKFSNIDLEIKDKSKYIFTPLLNACQTQKLDVIKLLVDAGADVNRSGSGKNHGNTPLMVCAWEGFTEGVKYLIEQEVSYNQQDNNGYTALHKACIKNNYGIAKLLINQTDLSIRDHTHRLAIECIDPKHHNSKALYELFRNAGTPNGK